MERYGIGVDLGGTKILAGVVELESGKVLASSKKRTVPTSDKPSGKDPKEGGKDKEKDSTKEKDKDLSHRIGDAIDEAIVAAGLPADTRFSGIGIGAAGQVDRNGKYAGICT